MNTDFINLTNENLTDEHLCCIIRSKKSHPGIDAKRQWLSERLSEGHIFRKLNAKATVFIEYAPLETAWVPIIGNNYYYLYCLWVLGSSKGKGYGKSLMDKEALYIEREKLITHLQISHEGLGIFTKDKKEILVNNLFTQYSNLISDSNLETTEEVFAISELQEIIHFINKNQQERSRGKGEKRMSVTINKNGRTFIVECIIFQDASFEISINDVTQEEEQVRLKRQLTQNIAHELKTPVSSIQGYLETIVSNENIPREKINVFLERCYAQSNRLSRLLRDISVLTRMDEAANMIDMERVDISVLVGNIINEVSLELDEKHITVVNSLKKSIQIKGNYSLLYSIFRNLMDNAIAYAGSNIQININCFREDENFYYFSFADTGIGVSPEHLNRLFERFYRVDKGRSRKVGGTGLGLAIVKNAVIIHGGSISAKNNQGGGLEFVFTLAKEK